MQICGLYLRYVTVCTVCGDSPPKRPPCVLQRSQSSPLSLLVAASAFHLKIFKLFVRITFVKILKLTMNDKTVCTVPLIHEGHYYFFVNLLPVLRTY